MSSTLYSDLHFILWVAKNIKLICKAHINNVALPDCRV